MRKYNLKDIQNGTYIYKNNDRRSQHHCVHYKENGYCKYLYCKCLESARCNYYFESASKATAPADKTMHRSFRGIEMIDVDKIKVKDCFKRTSIPQKKVNKVISYYGLHNCIDKPIYATVNGKKYLLEDNYARYCAAIQIGLSKVPVRIGNREKAKNEEFS